MSQTDKTLAEVLEGATGFDEIAVTRHFDGMDLYAGNEPHPMRVPRAVVFLHRRTEGDTDLEAKEFAMRLPMKDLNDYFADDPEELDDDEPATEVGKDDELSGDEPKSAPRGAS